MAWNGNCSQGTRPRSPAILSILDSDEGALPSEVFLEVPSSADIQKLNTPQNVSVHWLPRDGRPGLPGRYALDTVMKAALLYRALRHLRGG